MSALYAIRYQGVAGDGHGAVYVGKGLIIGIDITDARTHGSYQSDGSDLIGTAILTSAGGTLVTGQPVPPGTKVQVSFKLPQNFATGQFHQISVGGQPVFIAFDKIGDVP